MRVVILPARGAGHEAQAENAEHSTFNIQHSTPKKIPYNDWPGWARAIASQRIQGEAGVGDTAKRLLETPGVGLMTQGLVAGLALFGKKCGCARRQAEWNSRYNYNGMAK
jgi:hypothetical protein